MDGQMDLKWVKKHMSEVKNWLESRNLIVKICMYVIFNRPKDGIDCVIEFERKISEV